MTHFRSRTSLFALVIGLSAPLPLAALTVTETSDAFALANSLFLNVGSVEINGSVAPTFSGGAGQAGIYQNASGTYGLPSTGVVLSTGLVSDYVDGPDLDSGTSNGPDVVATSDQQSILGPITGQGVHYDVAELDISFFNSGGASSLTFFGAFGSEEYPEFVDTSFNDGFGLFVNGVNYAGVRTAGTGEVLPVNIDHPDFAPIAGTELNGLLAPGGNPVLRFDVPIVTGTNDFKVILADASDSALDTTVYLSSFFALPPDDEVDAPTGASEFDPLLPTESVQLDSGATVFTIPLPLEVEGTLWIDPPVTVGYTYELNGAQVSGITLPSLATVADLDGYTVEANGTLFESVLAGQMLDFGANVSTFTITGIDPTPPLVPGDADAFPIGLELVGLTSGATITVTELIDGGQTPVVPLPAGLPLYLAALGIGGLVARRRTRG